MHCAADVGFAAAVHFDAVHVPKVHKLDTHALYTRTYTQRDMPSDSRAYTHAESRVVRHDPARAGHMQRPTLHVRG